MLVLGPQWIQRTTGSVFRISFQSDWQIRNRQILFNWAIMAGKQIPRYTGRAQQGFGAISQTTWPLV